MKQENSLDEGICCKEVILCRYPTTCCRTPYCKIHLILKELHLVRVPAVYLLIGGNTWLLVFRENISKTSLKARTGFHLAGCYLYIKSYELVAGVFGLYTPPTLYLASLLKLQAYMMYVTLTNIQQNGNAVPLLQTVDNQDGSRDILCTLCTLLIQFFLQSTPSQ